MKKSRNKQKRKDWMKGLMLAAIIFLIAFVILYIYGYLSRSKDELVNKVNAYDSIEKYGYVLNDNVTTYYKDEFQKLKAMEDEQEIAEQVAKLFVIDLFSINYKVNKYEVTSAQYYYSDKREMFRNKVIDQLYNFVIDNSYDDRKQELPEVKEVTITDTKKDTYKLGDEKRECYVVKVSISYVKNLDYDNKAKIVLVKDNNNMSVVSYEAL
ncbi:MAG: hypothetical protein E7159_04295 [Firmicutes bacterium]|nr:hypothetical protein [Bacillota bacterium]